MARSFEPPIVHKILYSCVTKDELAVGGSIERIILAIISWNGGKSRPVLSYRRQYKLMKDEDWNWGKAVDMPLERVEEVEWEKVIEEMNKVTETWAKQRGGK